MNMNTMAQGIIGMTSVPNKNRIHSHATNSL